MQRHIDFFQRFWYDLNDRPRQRPSFPLPLTKLEEHNMKEKIKNILFGIFALVMAFVWIFALQDWQLLLFHVIPVNNIVAGIIFAVIGVVSLLKAFLKKK